MPICYDDITVWSLLVHRKPKYKPKNSTLIFNDP